jgi:class 3 adenylate cyclase/tetratricopeptide (TPR) repeat protein
VLCHSCGAENREGAKFCNECGTSLELLCSDCGQPYRAGQKFCEECGRSLNAAVTAAKTVPSPAVLAVAELRQVSVLFVDLVGFTALSEVRDAEDVRALLSRYFDAARTVVERYAGEIEKFIGDAVMAVWGVPVAREDDAERAVRAALEIVDAVTVLGQEADADRLQARAGVVTGQVAALESPGEGLVVGDRVNTASRVQSAAAPATVFVDEVTRQVTASAIAYEDAGEHSVKGKAEPLRLWRATRVVGGVRGSDREQGLDAPFVGRDADMRLLKDLFHAAADRGSARLVAVSGEAGLGKSRLRREFFNYIDGLADTYLWHTGRCLSFGDGVAYWALAEMVRQRLGIPEDASEVEAIEKLAAGLLRWIPDSADREFLAPRLGVLLGVGEPGLGRDELFAGWRLFFERLAAHEPVALVFEDLQWADAGLLDFIEQLLDWSATSPIFILTLARPDLVARPDGWPGTRRGSTVITLEPLDEPAMRGLLSALVDDLPPDAVGRIVARAQGVPLYALETVRALADRGTLVERNGRLACAGDIGELDVPASLSSLLAARLDALAAPERSLVKAMSVFGGSFPRSAAAALGEVGEERLDAILSALVRKGVLSIRTDPLSPDRGQYQFAQGLLRTVAYEMLSRQERKPRHLAAADHLARAFPNDGEDVAEVIAAHLLDAYRAAGGDPDADTLRSRTVAALRRAAQRAATVGAPETAERAYRTALELTEDEQERADLTEAAGRMALDAARIDIAIELLEAAVTSYRLAGETRRAARTVGAISRALGRRGRNTEAAERLIDALRTLPDSGYDADVALLSAELGGARVFSGRFDEAVAPLERALDVAQALDLPDVLCQALNDKAILLRQQGRAEESRMLLAGAAEVAERRGLTRELVRTLSNSGDITFTADLPGAVPQLETARALAHRRGDAYAEALSVGNLISAHLYAGNWDEAMVLAEGALAGDLTGLTAAWISLPLCALLAFRGELDHARQALANLAPWKDSDELQARWGYAVSRMVVSYVAGDLEVVAELGSEFIPVAIETEAASIEAVRNGWPIAVRAALELDRIDNASRLLTLLEAQPPGHVPPYLRAELANLNGLLAAAEGRQEDVEAPLRDSIDQLRDLAYPYWLAVAQTDLAAWLIDRERGGEASALVDEAVAALRALGAKPTLGRAEAVAARLAGAPAAG